MSFLFSFFLKNRERPLKVHIKSRRFKREQTYVHLWLIHVDIGQKPTQYCKAIILQLKWIFFFFFWVEKCLEKKVRAQAIQEKRWERKANAGGLVLTSEVLSRPRGFRCGTEKNNSKWEEPGRSKQKLDYDLENCMLHAFQYLGRQQDSSSL